MRMRVGVFQKKNRQPYKKNAWNRISSVWNYNVGAFMHSQLVEHFFKKGKEALDFGV